MFTVRAAPAVLTVSFFIRVQGDASGFHLSPARRFSPLVERSLSRDLARLKRLLEPAAPEPRRA